MELLRRATVEDEFPNRMVALLAEIMLSELFECESEPRQFQRMRGFFERMVEVLYEALST